MEELRAELEHALRLANQTERKLAVVAVVGDAVRELGLTLVVVGGLAVEYWTHGDYATYDIDVLLPEREDVAERLESLGFEREGRHWVLPGEDLFLEAPGSFLGHGDEIEEIELSPGRRVALLRPEDLLIYRLHEFVGTGHRDAVSRAVSLLQSGEVDHDRLARRASEEGLTLALDEVERLRRRVENGETIESWDLHEIARRLASQG